jgi:hypothetical protein
MRGKLVLRNAFLTTLGGNDPRQVDCAHPHTSFIETSIKGGFNLAGNKVNLQATYS